MVAKNPLDFVSSSSTTPAYTTTRAPGEIFLQLAVRAARDQRLKKASKGLLVELLTYHDGELPTAKDLYQAERDACQAEGLDYDSQGVIDRALDRLEELGYLVAVEVRDASGRRRMVRALTDSPGHHKLDIQDAYERAQEISRKFDRLTAERELLVQQPFQRPAHCPPENSLGVARDSKVISLADEREARRAS